MKIRFLATGVVRHIDNYNGQIAIDSGQAELVAKEDGALAPPKPGEFRCPNPEWEVVLRPRVMSGGEELAIRMRIMGTDYFYSGHPEHANAKVQWDGGQRFLSGLGREVPKEILQEYSKQWKKNENLRAPSSITLNDYNQAALGAFMHGK